MPQSLRVGSFVQERNSFTMDLSDSVGVIQSNITVTYVKMGDSIALRFDDVNGTTNGGHSGAVLTLDASNVPTALRPMADTRVMLHMINNGSSVEAATLVITEAGDWRLENDEGNWTAGAVCSFPNINYTVNYMR